MTTKKFWCHYIGADGNTPKRRSIELTDIHELLSNVTNEGAKNPLWFERKEDGYHQVYHDLYAQLSDSVAVKIIGGQLSPWVVERMSKSYEVIEAENRQRMEKLFSEYPNMSEERKAAEREYCERQIADQKNSRDRELAKIAMLQDYDELLLSGKGWISSATINAYMEVCSPVYPILQHLRSEALAERERDEERMMEEQRKREEEEARKKAEEERQEQERLTKEAEKFKNGESIAGADVVELCRRYGIAIHLRTVHNLQQVIVTINGKEGTCQYYRSRGKRRPQLDGCYETASKLYNHLQTELQ